MAVVFVALPAFAGERVSATVAPSGAEVVIPAHAVAVASHVFYLGSAIDPASGKVVHGYAFLHPKSNAAKPGGAGSGNTTCYSVMARGAKWKTSEPWVTNPSNAAGLDGGFVFSNLASDIAKWEDATDGVLGNGIAGVILGDGALTSDTLIADTLSPDGANEVYFGGIADPGVIAVTIVWGIFSGPTFARELVEWDQVYDDADYAWSATGAAGAMDFENIATHELGHTIGLGHPSDSCADETMYRFASLGETKKRTLNTGDVAGANQLY